MRSFTSDGPDLLPYATIVNARRCGDKDLSLVSAVYEWQGAPLIPSRAIRCARNLSWALDARSHDRQSSRCTPLSALRDDMALPSAVRGPVDFSHGLFRCIRSAAFARRSGVHALDVPIAPH